MTVKVKFKGDKIKVQAGEGYCPNVKDLLILTDNGNGYFVKRKSYVSTESDHVFNAELTGAGLWRHAQSEEI